MHEHEREIGRRDAAHPARLAKRKRADPVELLARLRAEVSHAGVVEAVGDRPLGMPSLPGSYLDNETPADVAPLSPSSARHVWTSVVRRCVCVCAQACPVPKTC